MSANDYKDKIIQGDSLEVLKSLPSESVNCVVTSPPYWALRDYGVAGQLGLEPTFYEYITKLCDIFDEVKRVLRKDGTCFVNIGDTYFGGNRNKGNTKSHLGGVVLDPFMGAATTAVVARKMKRKYLGIELNPQYIKIGGTRLSSLQLPLTAVQNK
jgi:DNA modification methylase